MTQKEAIAKLIALAEGEVGYLEKASNSELDHKTANAGDKNYTKYARDCFKDLQAQPWCDTFTDWLFIKSFGEQATKLMLGGISAYTPSSAQYYKNINRWFTEGPKAGDQVFFQNEVRIYHTGIVTRVDGEKIYTIEGNTSSGKEIVANGGGVYRKEYSLSHPNIAGYGRPNWTVVSDAKYKVGWNRDNKGWWYADTSNTYLRNIWKVINGHKYYFNSSGYAVTGWQEIDGKRYFFEDKSGAKYECALYVSDRMGVQKVGSF